MIKGINKIWNEMKEMMKNDMNWLIWYNIKWWKWLELMRNDEQWLEFMPIDKNIDKNLIKWYEMMKDDLMWKDEKD